MVTPFAENGSLDTQAARKLASYLVDNGSHGVVVAGTTGESATLSDDEKIALLEAVLDEIGSDHSVICGTGSNDTRHTANLTHRAAQAGAHGVLVVAPYYNKPIEPGLRAHFAEASEAAGATPIALYNIPARSVINLDPEFIASLAAEFENIVALKQANNQEIGPIPGIQMLAGNDDVFSRCLREGGTGGVLVASHVVGPKMREIYDAAAQDEHDRALELERELADVYAALAVAPPASSVKAVLSMQGLIGETQRLPMIPVTGPARETLREIAEAVG